MQDNFVIKSKNFDKKDQNDLKSIENIFDNNEDLSGNSQIVIEYEKELSLKFNKKYSVAVSSGTSAIYLALTSLNLKKNDEIIIPVTAATMSAIPALILDLKIVFVDSSKNNTFEIDIAT